MPWPFIPVAAKMARISVSKMKVYVMISNRINVVCHGCLSTKELHEGLKKLNTIINRMILFNILYITFIISYYYLKLLLGV